MSTDFHDELPEDCPACGSEESMFEAEELPFEEDLPAVVEEPTSDLYADRHVDESGREFDRTSLKAQKEGYMVHRDYAAHFFRWSWLGRHFNDRANNWDVLEVGCGVDCPLVRLIKDGTVRKAIPRSYLGVDLNQLVDPPKTKWANFQGSFNFTQSFADYMTMLRGRGAYMNLGVVVGHSAVRTAVMGNDASVRKMPTAAEITEMKRLVGEAMDQGAIGVGASYSLNHSGWGGVPMPSTISEVSEFDTLVGAMGGPGRGVVEISSGPIMPDAMEEIAARHGRRIFMSTAIALYNDQYPQRALGVFEACGAAQARDNELYIQITCQPLSFDFTLASAYPFYSHPTFDPIKAYDREQLKTVFRDPSFRSALRADLRNPKPGTVFQGN